MYNVNQSIDWRMGAARADQMAEGISTGLETLADLTGVSSKAKSKARREAMYDRAFGPAEQPRTTLSALTDMGRNFLGMPTQPVATAAPGSPQAARVAGNAKPNWQPESMAQNAEQAAYSASQPATAQGGQGGGLDAITNRELIDIIRDPYADAGEKEFAKSLFTQRMTPADPFEQKKREIELQLKQAELAQMGQPKPTDDMREYEFARSQGYTGSFADYQMANRRAGATTVNNNLGDSYDGALGKSLGGGVGEMFSGMAREGVNARAELGQIRVLRDQLSRTPGGFWGGAQNIASGFGIKLGDGASSAEAANAIISKLVPTQRLPGSGTMSDADLALFRDSLPKLSNTAEGNAVILDTMEALASYKAAQSEIATAVAMRQLTPAQGLERINALPDPFARFKSLTGAGAATPAPAPAAAIPPPPQGVNPNEWPAIWEAMTTEQRGLFQ